MLSRLPQETGIVQATTVVGSDAIPEAGGQWKDWQEGDNTLAQVKECVECVCCSWPPKSSRKEALPAVRYPLREWSQLHIQEGALKLRAQLCYTILTLSQIMVPTSKTHELWKKYQNASSHMGVAKIQALLRKTGQGWALTYRSGHSTVQAVPSRK